MKLPTLRTLLKVALLIPFVAYARRSLTAIKMSASISPPDLSSPIGFIGVGIMGRGMLKNLVTKLPEAQFVVWNRSPEAISELTSSMEGSLSSRVSIASTAREVVQSCDVTFSMLSTMEASEAVFEGESGVLSGITDGKVVVDCATLTPERMSYMAEAVQAKNGLFLEAPVSGSKVPAETGTLIFLCGGGSPSTGGDDSVFERVKPALDCMGKASFFFGPVGAGSKVKLIVNMLLGTVMTSFAEGIALCEAASIPADQLLQVLDLGALSNPMFKGKGPNMIKRSFAPHFPLKHQQKDLRFALALGDELGVSLPLTAAANEQFKKARKDHGDEDFSAVLAAYVDEEKK